MPNRTEHAPERDLRSRAVSRLTGEAARANQSASQALGVLHELASSSATAADALALLHELQVHQVELELQAEELRVSRAELETALRRKTQLYDSAPVGCFTLDLDGVLCELNLTGSALLGCEREVLLGQSLLGYLAPHSARELQARLKRAGKGHRDLACALQLVPHEGTSRMVYASVNVDPAGGAFLLALLEAASNEQA